MCQHTACSPATLQQGAEHGLGGPSHEEKDPQSPSRSQCRARAALHDEQKCPKSPGLPQSLHFCCPWPSRDWEKPPLWLSISVFPYEKKKQEQTRALRSLFVRSVFSSPTLAVAHDSPSWKQSGAAQGQGGLQDFGARLPREAQTSIALWFSAASPIYTFCGCGFVISEVPWKL